MVSQLLLHGPVHVLADTDRVSEEKEREREREGERERERGRENLEIGSSNDGRFRTVFG